MNNLDKHLQRIQEDNIQEIDPVTSVLVAGAVGGSLLVLANLLSLLSMSAQLIRAVKIDPEISRRVNAILNSGNKWVVHIYPDKGPNAFSLGFGRHIYITSALLKILTKDEVDAVMLHEVYHSSAKHTPKRLVVKYPLYYLAATVAIAVGFATVATGIGPIAAYLCFLLVNGSGDILYNVTFGRRHEIKADDFAVKNGYGKQLINAFEKMDKWVAKNVKRGDCNKICRIMNKVDAAIDEHPSTEARVKNILEGMEKAKAITFSKIKTIASKIWRNNG